MSDKRIINNFLKLVKINSTSGNEAAVRRYLLQELRRLGCKTRTDKKGNIHTTIRGKLARGATVLFNAHMDTVVPGENIKPRISKDRIVSDGTTILGADDKAGIAAILELISLLKEKQIPFYQIKIIFTVEEEIGLCGAKALKPADVKADYCFVLDSDGDIGTVVNRSPAQEVLTFRVRGKSAHAGLNPEDGINTIKIAALAISKIRSGRIDRETTANIGTIRGGTVTNIVPDETTVVAEARSRNEKKLHKQVRSMTKAFQKAARKFGGSAQIGCQREYEAVNQPENSPIIRIAKTAAQKVKVKHRVLSSGGGSDASIIFACGVPTVGLGIGMENVHTKQEYITLRNLTTLPHYLLALLGAVHNYDQHHAAE